MATIFFRIPETGSLKRPTPVAIMWFAALAIVSAIILNDFPIICVLIFWPVEYVLCSLIFSAPVRVGFSRMLHWTRYPHVVTPQTARAYDLWRRSNEDKLKKTGLCLFMGRPREQTLKPSDAMERKSPP